MAQQLHVRRGFRNTIDQQLIAAAGAVITGLTDNKAFQAPPIDLAALQAQLDQLVSSIADLPHGGVAATAEKNNKRDRLIASLRKLAHYVEDSSNNDPAVLLSSGFSAVSASRTQSPLPAPVINAIDNGHTTQLIVRIRAIPNAKSYEARYSAIGADGVRGAWQSGGIFTTSRAMRVTGLTPGTNYAFQVRAIGGSTGYSDWGDPVMHMSM